MSTRLTRELRLLYIVEAHYKLPAAPIIRQLVTWEDRPLPDVIPDPPQWTKFNWPVSGEVDYQGYWRGVDGGKGIRWAGPYL